MGAGDEAGEKKFDPTPRKLQRLREQGSVPKSAELGPVLTFIAAVIFLTAGGNFIWQRILSLFHGLWKAIPLRTFDMMGPGYIIEYSVKQMALILVPLLLLVALTAIIADVMQVGFMFTTQRLFKLDSLNPANYFKRIFSLRGVVQLLVQLLKVTILGFVAYRAIKKHWIAIMSLIGVSHFAPVEEVFKKIILDFTIEAAVALFVVAIAELFYQRFQFTRDNRMTLKQLIDEMKEIEGDPYVKAQRRALAKRLNQRQQVMSIPEADFVTTNPSKIAVAIKYTAGEMSAPKVIAKGGDSFAWLLITTAKRHNIPVIENVPLARALYRLVKVDQEVPPELYRAVAEILLFAYQIRGKAKMSTNRPRSTS